MQSAILVMVARPPLSVCMPRAILSVGRKFPLLPHRQVDIYSDGILLCRIRRLDIIIGKCGSKHIILLASYQLS